MLKLGERRPEAGCGCTLCAVFGDIIRDSNQIVPGRKHRERDGFIDGLLGGMTMRTGRAPVGVETGSADCMVEGMSGVAMF